MLCKLLQRGSVALVLIILSGDVEVNPGFMSLDDVKSIRGLKIAHLNVRSLRYKSNLLRLEGLDNNTIDVLTLSETWLDESIKDSEISLPGFVCVRKDRTGIKKGYGGVAIIVRFGLPVRVRYDIDVGQSECLWIEIARAKCKPVIICCAYRAPDKNVDDFISRLYSCMPALNLEKLDLVFLGDLNVNMSLDSKTCSSERKKLLNFMHTMDLVQLIKEPTRVTNTARSLIDVILVNNEHRIIDSGVVPMSLSDHSLVFCVLKVGVPKAKPRTMEYRSYKHFDVNSFNKDLNNVPWNIVDNEENIDDALHTWNCLFSEIADEHAPIKKRRMRGIASPWMNNKISEAMRDRDYHHRKAIKTNSPAHWKMYKKLRNHVTREVKIAKSKHYCTFIQEAKGDSNKIWKAVNEAAGRGVKTSSPQFIFSDGVQHSTLWSIASCLNSYFVSIGKVLVDKITPTNVLNETEADWPENSFRLNELDESTVLQQLLSLQTNKAIGLDKISARLLKCAAYSICPSITKLLNRSIQSNKFPQIWKCSKVSALFKSGERTDPANYRPVSILPTRSKILERAVHSQLYYYLNSNNLLSNAQFGFRQKRSTVTALSSLTDEI